MSEPTSRSAPESRVKCWKCGKKVRLRKDGTLGAHGADPAWLAGVGEFLLPHCDATGKKP